MRRAVKQLVFTTFFGLLAAAPLRAAEPVRALAAPDFQEVYDLIREHLAGMNAADLNRTAVESLIAALTPSVSLEGSAPNDSIQTSGGPLINKASLFDGPIAYLRVSRVEQGLADALRQGYQHLATNRLNGVVLDLRFSGGNDYAAAASTADLFVKQEKPLLNWGQGVVRSKQKSDAITVPVAVLVNRETSRAAEALAAVLRDTGTALIIGSRTAGQGLIAKEFPLKNGQKLRIATTPIEVGEGTPLTVQGVKPDLAVNVSMDDERAYMADAFKQLQAAATNTLASRIPGSTDQGATNRVRRPRFNEAELIRERRDGGAPDLELSGRDAETEKPVVRDPALARGLDVLKGLAVVRQARS